jgi:pimeloyl-ACP methyl ester carboxylesterase
VLSSRWRPRATLAAAVLALLGLAGPSGALARPDGGPKLDWAACGDGFECATITVPLDYRDGNAGTLALPVARMPATDPGKRLGTLIVNFGGPGDPTSETLRAGAVAVFAGLNDRYDILGFDPRGTGGTDAIDCDANIEEIGPIAQPFPTPDTLDPAALVARDKAYLNRCVERNPRILPYANTANTARDMDCVRSALGEDKIDYVGFSYGSFLGATYETLFPEHVGRFVLDAALDADALLNDPVQIIREQTKSFEVALGRFFHACAAHQDVCLGFGGDDPSSAFDELVEQMNASPLPAGGPDPRPVDGDDLLAGSALTLYAKQAWPILAEALATAAAGDGTIVRFLADAFYGRRDDGTYDPGWDRFFAISSTEMRFPGGIERYLKIGAEDFQLFDHYWWNSGYSDLAQALWPVEPKGAYYRPYEAPEDALTTLVVGTTYDPATPYKGAKRLVAQLGNARLLTMRGDGHAAYFGNSACIDAAVEAYLEQGTLPVAGTVCRQEVPFAPLPAAATTGETKRSGSATRPELRHHVRRLPPLAAR